MRIIQGCTCCLRLGVCRWRVPHLLFLWASPPHFQHCKIKALNLTGIYNSKGTMKLTLVGSKVKQYYSTFQSTNSFIPTDECIYIMKRKDETRTRSILQLIINKKQFQWPWLVSGGLCKWCIKKEVELMHPPWTQMTEVEYNYPGL